MKSLALLFCASVLAASAQTFTVLASFSVPGSPRSLLQGADGNFYGIFGNQIFQCTPAGALSALYTFPKNTNANSLIQASDGNFYGTTPAGADPVTQGTIFKLTPTGTLTTLYTFDGTSGSDPTTLLQGSDGNFYGTTQYGGATSSTTSNGDGTFFKITPAGALTLLHSFSGSDGSLPGSLTQGSDGNFYGVTLYGGSGNCPSTESETRGCGTIFKITPAGMLTTLFTSEPDGSGRPKSFIQASDGNLYGTSHFGGPANCTFSGNATGCGAVFKMTPAGVLTTLYTFTGTGTDGSGPDVLIQASDGNLYGNTNPVELGKCSGTGCGTIYKLSLDGTEAIVHTFAATPTGSEGVNSMIQGADGNLYGTTDSGGTFDLGSLFQLSLASNIPAIAATGGILNGASFQPGIGADGWMTINGTNLSTKTDTWTIVKGVLPTMLDGVSVMIGGQPAYIEYVSPTQINAIAPAVPAGNVAVTVTNATGTSQAATVQLSAEAPAFFQWGNYAVATRQDFSLAVKNGTFPGTTTVPAKPGDVIILWGTGFGPTSPTAPAGMQTPSTTTYNTANAVSVTVGGKSATVYGAALAPGYAGLYQIAIQIPAGLANGDYPVVATIAGVQSPSTTMITVKQ